MIDENYYEDIIAEHAYNAWYEDDRYYNMMKLVDNLKDSLKCLTGNVDNDIIRSIKETIEEIENA